MLPRERAPLVRDDQTHAPAQLHSPRETVLRFAIRTF